MPDALSRERPAFSEFKSTQECLQKLHPPRIHIVERTDDANLAVVLHLSTGNEPFRQISAVFRQVSATVRADLCAIVNL